MPQGLTILILVSRLLDLGLEQARLLEPRFLSANIDVASGAQSNIQSVIAAVPVENDATLVVFCKDPHWRVSRCEADLVSNATAEVQGKQEVFATSPAAPRGPVGFARHFGRGSGDFIRLGGGDLLVAAGCHDSVRKGRVCLQRIRESGQAATHVADVPPGFIYSFPRMAAVPAAGGGWLAWEQDDLWVARISPEGEVADLRIVASVREVADPDSVDVTATSEGLVVVWNGPWEGGDRVLMQRFNADLSTAGPIIKVQEQDGEAIETRVASGPDGSIAVIWTSRHRQQTPVCLRLFGSDGRPLTGEVLLDSEPSISPRIASLTSGFATAWRVPLGPGLVMTAELTSTGAFASEPQLVGVGTHPGPEYFEIENSDHASWRLYWRAARQNSSHPDLGLAYFDP